MSDAAVTTIVTGAVNVVGLIVGLMVLWIKAKETGEKADKISQQATTAAEKAIKAAAIATAAIVGIQQVKAAVDDNTQKTEAVAVAVNGHTQALKDEILQLKETIARMVREDANRAK